MKKELALHFLTSIILFVVISILRNYLNLNFWPLWIGALVGTILPDIDHLIYVYYLRPHELTSQRIMYAAGKGQLQESWHLLATTRSERTNLILHTVTFQILFVVLSFLVVTSSSSLLGRGLVLAFLLHLLVDEVIDLKQNGNLLNWFRQIPIQLDKIQLNVYLIANLAIILVFGILL
ncbi:MAG TPA: metal-dependent hydrolase [Candidatus Saccharimonadales bacterium]|nr:metal-dependent hydrolase [Candidatus Saccharimonadales bacterium]